MLFYIISIGVILGLIILNLIYRWQIKDIWRQIDFIRKYDTNKMINLDTDFREVNVLVDKLNKLINMHKDIVKEYRVKDESLKQSLTNISHDIRTPLTSLSGYFQLLIDTDSEEEEERYIKIIEGKIENLKHFLEDLLSYMKIQDMDYNLEFEDCNISEIVSTSILSYYENFKSKDIEPQIYIEEELIAYSNKGALNRIVDNLIYNGLIHGGNYIDISLGQDNGKIYFLIKNDIENPEDMDMENIFTRFYKNDKARATNSTGLGLTIVKELVESLGGSIYADLEKDIFSIKIII